MRIRYISYGNDLRALKLNFLILQAYKAPVFLTDLMNNWLLFHDVLQNSKIGKIGLFEWELKPTQKSELKIRKKPVIKKFEQYGKSSDLNIYFFELNSTTLHVFQSHGFSLSGTKNIYQYILKNGKLYRNDKPLISFLS